MPRRLPRSASLFAGGLVVFVIAAAATVAAAWLHESDVALVEHTTDVRNAISDVSTHWRYLRGAAPKEALVVMADSLAELRRLVSDNSRQLAQLNRIAELVGQPRDDADTVRTLLHSMVKEEAELQATRHVRARASLNRIYLTTSAGLGAALLLIIAAWRRLGQQLRETGRGLRQLKISEAKLAALLESGTDAVWAVDVQQNVTVSNHKFRKLVFEVAEMEDLVEAGPRSMTFAHHETWSAYYRRALAGERFTIELIQHIRGRQRYFLLSFSPIVVDGTITGAASSAKDITTRKRAELKLAQRAETLHYLSVVDEMTGAYNRRGFLELGAAILRDARSQGQTVVLLFADLDGLKAINDGQGHAAGDVAIQSAARTLQESVRKTDLVGRIGGDEFVVLATRLEDEGMVIDRIQKNAALRGVRMSIGVVKEEGGDGTKSLEQLISGADAIMYEQKAARKSAHLRLVSRNHG